MKQFLTILFILFSAAIYSQNYDYVRHYQDGVYSEWHKETNTVEDNIAYVRLIYQDGSFSVFRRKTNDKEIITEQGYTVFIALFQLGEADVFLVHYESVDMFKIIFSRDNWLEFTNFEEYGE